MPRSGSSQTTRVILKLLSADLEVSRKVKCALNTARSYLILFFVPAIRTAFTYGKHPTWFFCFEKLPF